MELFYITYARRVRQYGIMVYGCIYKSHLDEIYKMQKKNNEAVFFKRNLNSAREIMNENGIPLVFEMFCTKRFKTLYKAMQDKTSMRKIDGELGTNAYQTCRKAKSILPSVSCRINYMKKSQNFFLIIA